MFVTATLPQSVREQLRVEFPDLKTVTGPGLHKVSPLMKLSIVDCSTVLEVKQDSGNGGSTIDTVDRLVDAVYRSLPVDLVDRLPNLRQQSTGRLGRPR